MMPNLVLLNVGTNDCLQNIDTANAGSRLKVLIDDIYASIPGVTVIISSVLPNKNTADNPCTVAVSAQYKTCRQLLSFPLRRQASVFSSPNTY